MKLENQVCSLELSKKMRELGFEQESAFYWRNAGQVGWQIENEVWMRNKKEDAYSAYTVAELGEMLPDLLNIENKIYYFGYANGNGKKSPNYIYHDNDIGFLLTGYPVIKADNEADARAKMLIYLKEQELI